MAETAKAICVIVPNDDDEERWVPKAALSDESQVYGEDDTGKLVLFAWYVDANDFPAGEAYREDD